MVDHPFLGPEEIERQRADQRERGELRDLQARTDLEQVMGTTHGRRVMWRLLQSAGVGRSSFNTNAVLMARVEGCREFGEWLRRLLRKHCLDQFRQMENECEVC